MKKYRVVLVLLFILKTASSFADVDLSIGGTAWYAWWQPAWSDAKSTSFVLQANPGLFIEDSHDFKPTSNAMAGPVVSLSFLGRWSIQSVFTIGKFKSFSSGPSYDAVLFSNHQNLVASYKKYTRDILKWDSDTSIGCAVHRMVKIFAGFKTQGYRYEERLDDVMYEESLMLIHRALVDDVKAYGCGLGLGLTIPLGADFYLMMSASGLVLWSFEKININRSKSYMVQKNGPYFLPVIQRKGRYLSYGGSAALSLAYNIKKIDTTISLGGRYQLLLNRQRYNNLFFNDVAMNIIDGQYDHFFGVTVSAIYTFHIGKKV
jgi:hypothetical protein